MKVLFIWVLIVGLSVGGYFWLFNETELEKWKRETGESNAEMELWRKERDSVYELYGYEKGRLVLDVKDARRELERAERDGKSTEVLRVVYERALKRLDDFDRRGQ